MFGDFGIKKSHSYGEIDDCNLVNRACRVIGVYGNNNIFFIQFGVKNVAIDINVDREYLQNML